MTLCRYGLADVIVIVAVGAVLTAAIGWRFGAWAALPAVLTLATLAFYRDPTRAVPAGDNLLLAPADGRVVETAADAPDAEGRRCLRIAIFLSVFDVHINRSPCAGRVTDVLYTPGQFLSALRNASMHLNECNRVLLTPAAPLPGPIVVRQIAGVLARRIACAVRPGSTLAAGQRFGMIKLGSRTEVSAPADPRWELCVRAGDRVLAGVTVLARLRRDVGGPT